MVDENNINEIIGFFFDYMELFSKLKKKNIKIVTNLALPFYVNTQNQVDKVEIVKIDEIENLENKEVVCLYSIFKDSDGKRFAKCSFTEPLKEYRDEKEFYFQVPLGEDWTSLSFTPGKDLKILQKDKKDVIVKFHNYKAGEFEK